MASRSYVSFRDAIYRDITEKLERRNDGNQKFAPKGLVGGVLNMQMLRQLYQILMDDGQEQLRITEGEFIDRIEQRKLRRFIAILVYAVCPIEAVWMFVTQLVAPNAWPLESTRGTQLGVLPASAEDLEIIFRDTVTKDKFYEAQFIFCTVVILRGKEVIVKHPTLERMPYLEEPQKIGAGSFGTVYRVYVARRHIVNEADDTENREPKKMARKDYILDDAGGTHAEKEREILNTLLRTPTGACKNILRSLGSIRVGHTYSLFMELALYDLRYYMTDLHDKPPRTIQDKAELVRSAAGLAAGLNFLHTQLRLEDGTEIVCYHMDLKPDNILVFRDTERGSDFKIWKLSDFGMARVKTKQSRRYGESERDFNSLFKRRNQSSDPTASATVNNRGEGTYLAPESVSSNRRMKASSDVWALGCVLSVLFTYMENGREGIMSYSEKRAGRSRSEGCDDRDRFFLYNSRLTSIKRHPAASDWHRQLVKQAERRNKNEAQIIANMLRYIDKSILVIEQTKREPASNVQKELERAYQLYRDLEEVNPEQSPVERQPPLWKSLLHKFHKNPEESASYHWQITTTPKAGFKGCRIAPSGKLAAFWTDTEIVLFTSSSLSTRKGEAINGPEYCLDPGEGLWNSVDLTDRYLVASTARKGRNFQCYIFRLQAGSSVEPSLDSFDRVSIPLQEIHRLAISPDSKRLACLLGNDQDERSPGCLFLARIHDLLTQNRHGHENQGTETGESIMKLSRRIPINWAAGNSTHFSFANDNTIVIVMRLEPGAQSRGHMIPIILLSLSTNAEDDEMLNLQLQLPGSDGGSNTVPFFTSLAVFHGERSCVVVTREKLVHVISASHNDTERDIQEKVANYRILRVMIDRSNNRLLAIAATSTSNKLLLGEMNRPIPGRKISFREVCKIPRLFYGDDFTERLVEEGTRGFVLITTLAGRDAPQGAIIKIELDSLP